MKSARICAASLPVLCLVAACGGPAPHAPSSGGGAPAAITNRIPLPPEVVANLGITFEKAKRGRLEKRFHIPGRVEVAPEARYAVRAPASGRFVTKTARWQTVKAGDVLGELLAPDLRTAQEALAATQESLDRADVEARNFTAEAAHTRALADSTDAALASAKDRMTATESALTSAQGLERAALARLESMRRPAGEPPLPSGVLFTAGKEHVEAQAAAIAAAKTRDDARAAVPELAAKAGVARSRVTTVELELGILERRKATSAAGLRQQLRALSALTGVPVEQLTAGETGKPAWLALEAVPLRAPASGTIVELPASDGEWVEASTVVARVVDRSRVVFRGEVPESDAARITANASARIEVGCTACAIIEATLSAPISTADPRTRTVSVEFRLPGDGSAFPDGASATASVLIERSPSEEILVPAVCVVQDELQTVLFRRDPAKPDQVIRTSVSTGRRSEGWIEILSEVGEGDEVVRDGIQQLRLTGIGKAPANGHFHADGTWHEGKE